eukprot:scaffold15013_cov148-Cylindrotheca_fusiformis.AAC.1
MRENLMAILVFTVVGCQKFDSSCRRPLTKTRMGFYRQQRQQAIIMVKLEEDIFSMKGDEVVFVSGLYGSQTGWINTQEEPDHDENLPMIVLMKSGREKVTFMKKDKARRAFTDPPGPYAEAVIQQRPTAKRSYVEVARSSLD